MKTGDSGWNAVAETKESLEIVIGIPETLRGDGREYYVIRAHGDKYSVLKDMDDAPDTINFFVRYLFKYLIFAAVCIGVCKMPETVICKKGLRNGIKNRKPV